MSISETTREALSSEIHSCNRDSIVTENQDNLCPECYLSSKAKHQLNQSLVKHYFLKKILSNKIKKTKPLNVLNNDYKFKWKLIPPKIITDYAILIPSFESLKSDSTHPSMFEQLSSLTSKHNVYNYPESICCPQSWVNRQKVVKRRHVDLKPNSIVKYVFVKEQELPPKGVQDFYLNRKRKIPLGKKRRYRQLEPSKSNQNMNESESYQEKEIRNTVYKNSPMVLTIPEQIISTPKMNNNTQLPTSFSEVLVDNQLSTIESLSTKENSNDSSQRSPAKQKSRSLMQLSSHLKSKNNGGSFKNVRDSLTILTGSFINSLPPTSPKHSFRAHNKSTKNLGKIPSPKISPTRSPVQLSPNRSLDNHQLKKSSGKITKIHSPIISPTSVSPQNSPEYSYGDLKKSLEKVLSQNQSFTYPNNSPVLSSIKGSPKISPNHSLIQSYEKISPVRSPMRNISFKKASFASNDQLKYSQENKEQIHEINQIEEPVFLHNSAEIEDENMSFVEGDFSVSDTNLNKIQSSSRDSKQKQLTGGSSTGVNQYSDSLLSQNSLANRKSHKSSLKNHQSNNNFKKNRVRCACGVIHKDSSHSLPSQSKELISKIFKSDDYQTHIPRKMRRSTVDETDQISMVGSFIPSPIICCVSNFNRIREDGDTVVPFCCKPCTSELPPLCCFSMDTMDSSTKNRLGLVRTIDTAILNLLSLFPSEFLSLIPSIGKQEFDKPTPFDLIGLVVELFRHMFMGPTMDETFIELLYVLQYCSGYFHWTCPGCDNKNCKFVTKSCPELCPN